MIAAPVLLGARPGMCFSRLTVPGVTGRLLLVAAPMLLLFLPAFPIITRAGVQGLHLGSAALAEMRTAPVRLLL